ncbi:hypothetical protein [Psychrobacter sp. FME5]|uniref:hypothetical protein n=1 Tax=Psychrobacter sp. FME5 TaxID=2487706 RepID=UPI00178839C9|nr:hypothetical protein [Psychrobacter sp. FME5]MBE0446157.1 hypothetical protein [Psychrobacter sp. FME5]
MNKKEMRPLSSKSSTDKPVKSRQKMWLVLILVLIAIGYLVSKQSGPEVPKPVSESASPSMTEQTGAAQSASIPIDNETNETNELENSEVTADNSQAAPMVTDPTTSDSEAILNAPLPETDSLAKEEIDRLEDTRKRLAEQEKLAAEQVAMNKQLTEMKAEQIELLEQQIAQIEARTDPKPNTK